MKEIQKLFYMYLVLLFVISCAKPSEPAPIEGSLTIEHQFETSGYARDIHVSDSNLYIAEDQAGYSIFDLESDSLVSHHESFIMDVDPILFENVRAISFFEDENLLFVYDQYGSPASINGFDITDKINPIFQFRLSGNTGSIIQLEPYASLGGGVDLYWTSGNFVNFSSSDISWQGSTEYAFQNSVAGFDIDNNIMCLAAEQLGFHIVDKSSGNVLSTTDTDAEALDVKIVDNYAIIALRQSGFAVYDVSDSLDPVLVCQRETNEYIYTIDIEEDNLVLGSHNGGVYLYDISDITDPALVGNLNSDKIGYTYEAVLHNGKIYASTRQGVYKIGIN